MDPRSLFKTAEKKKQQQQQQQNTIVLSYQDNNFLYHSHDSKLDKQMIDINFELKQGGKDEHHHSFLKCVNAVTSLCLLMFMKSIDL